jgi:hemoglobin-like flavoprotein
MHPIVGTKHVTLGVPVNTFPIMGESLLQTLSEKLGDKFTREVEDSWIEVYRVLSNEMILAMSKKK